MDSDFDAVVVGAGVMGLAVARALATAGHSVLILEKAAAAGSETSSRNSEVIHAGIYYPPKSLKARFCVEGRTLLYDYCATFGVNTQQLGKLIVATSPDEHAKLDSIAETARANGVSDLEWLSAQDVAQLEPELTCTKALLSPSTGIIDSQAYMLSLQAVAESRGATFAFNSQFISATKSATVFQIVASSASGENTELTCHFIFNCAGHGGHSVATAINDFPVDTLPNRFLAKGSYCSVSGKNPFQRLIYPVPVPGALGIHATLDLGGALRLGPDIMWTDTLDYSLPLGLPEKFTTAVQKYWPGVRDRSLAPSYCGVRPKIHGPDTGFADFVIQNQAQHGIVGLVNLFGFESPGLTSSLAAAQAALAANGLS